MIFDAREVTCMLGQFDVSIMWKTTDSFFIRLHDKQACNVSTIYFTACFTLPVSHTGTHSHTTCVVTHSTNPVKRNSEV